MAQSIICAVNIMNSSQNWKEGGGKKSPMHCKYIFFVEPQLRSRFPNGFWNGFNIWHTFTVLLAKRSFKVIHKNHTL